MIDFGKRVKERRLEQHLTKEEFCGDESELSVRQLTRIESGASMPTLAKVEFIAERLGVKIGDLTDPERFELPKRYKDLKFLLLRTQTFMDPKRLAVREAYFEEIFEQFYDILPEDEQLIIEILHCRLELFTAEHSFAASKIIQEYFEQTKQKRVYNINDLILLDLYFPYVRMLDFDCSAFQKSEHTKIVKHLCQQLEQLPREELFFLAKTLSGAFANSLILEQEEDLRQIINVFEQIVQEIQDFQKTTILNLLKWKYILFKDGDKEQAQQHYQNACLFAQIVDDRYLIQQIEIEWKKDLAKFKIG